MAIFSVAKPTRPSRSSVCSGSPSPGVKQRPGSCTENTSFMWGKPWVALKIPVFWGGIPVSWGENKKKLFEKDHLGVSLFFLQCHVSSFQTSSAPCCYHKFSNGKTTTDGDSSSLEKPTVRWCSLIFFVTLCHKESLKPGGISPASRTSRTGHWHYSSNSNSNEPTTWWRQGRWQRVNHTPHGKPRFV